MCCRSCAADSGEKSLESSPRRIEPFPTCPGKRNLLWGSHRFLGFRYLFLGSHLCFLSSETSKRTRGSLRWPRSLSQSEPADRFDHAGTKPGIVCRGRAAGYQPPYVYRKERTSTTDTDVTYLICSPLTCRFSLLFEEFEFQRPYEWTYIKRGHSHLEDRGHTPGRNMHREGYIHGGDIHDGTTKRRNIHSVGTYMWSLEFHAHREPYIRRDKHSEERTRRRHAYGGEMKHERPYTGRDIQGGNIHTEGNVYEGAYPRRAIHTNEHTH